jgi:hypothetical protein
MDENAPVMSTHRWLTQRKWCFSSLQTEIDRKWLVSMGTEELSGRTATWWTPSVWTTMGQLVPGFSGLVVKGRRVRSTVYWSYCTTCCYSLYMFNYVYICLIMFIYLYLKLVSHHFTANFDFKLILLCGFWCTPWFMVVICSDAKESRKKNVTRIHSRINNTYFPSSSMKFRDPWHGKGSRPSPLAMVWWRNPPLTRSTRMNAESIMGRRSLWACRLSDGAMRVREIPVEYAKFQGCFDTGMAQNLMNFHGWTFLNPTKSPFFLHVKRTVIPLLYPTLEQIDLILRSKRMRDIWKRTSQFGRRVDCLALVPAILELAKGNYE